MIPLKENNDLLPHYEAKKVLHASFIKSRDGLKTLYKHNIITRYDLSKQSVLQNSEYATYNSGNYGAFVQLYDEELRKLKINSTESLNIEFNSIYIETFSSSLFWQLMNHKIMKLIVLVLFGISILTLITASIALIPAVSSALASIHLSTPLLFIICGLLIKFTGIIICFIDMAETPVNIDYDITVQQEGIPESKISFSEPAREKVISREKLYPILRNRFFPTEISSSVPNIEKLESPSSLEGQATCPA
jgi:hypothetical protein